MSLFRLHVLDEIEVKNNVYQTSSIAHENSVCVREVNIRKIWLLLMYITGFHKFKPMEMRWELMENTNQS